MKDLQADPEVVVPTKHAGMFPPKVKELLT